MNNLRYEPEKSFEKRASVAIQYGKQHQKGSNGLISSAALKELISLSNDIDVSESSIDDANKYNYNTDAYTETDPIKTVSDTASTITFKTCTSSSSSGSSGSTGGCSKENNCKSIQLTQTVSSCLPQHNDAATSVVVKHAKQQRRASQFAMAGYNSDATSGLSSQQQCPTSPTDDQEKKGNAIQTIFRQPKNLYENYNGSSKTDTSSANNTYDNVDFKVPNYFPNMEEECTITKSLTDNFMFRTLNKNELKLLVSAFEPCQFNNGDIIIQQGDIGDYFYVLHEGQVSFFVDNVQIGTTNEPGTSFGELALLYSSPRAATVIASNTTTGSTITTLLRVDKYTFRHILRTQTSTSSEIKKQLLYDVPFIKDLGDTYIRKLMKHMTPGFFNVGDIAAEKGTFGDKFFIIHEGQFVCKDISVGNKTYEDLHLGPGDYFGERSLVTSEPRVANVVCTSKGVTFSIDKHTFEKVLGKMSDVIMHAQDIRILGGIPLIHKTLLNDDQLAALSSKVFNKTYTSGQTIFSKGENVQARIFIVRKGQVIVQSTDNGTDAEIISPGGYFGEQIAQMALKTFDGYTTASHQALAVEDTVCGILNLNECIHIIESTTVDIRELSNTTQGLSNSGNSSNTGTTKNITVSHSNKVDKNGTDKRIIPFSDLAKIDVLGEGTFGQVWMVCDTKEKNTPYALKIQSKRELLKEGQAKAVILEKNIMSKIRHPFIVKLINTYQDNHFIYMLLQMIQGGELFNVLHDSPNHCLQETEAKFYSCCIADAIVYMSLRRVVYRDLKPENIMIDNIGYPKIVDFGFAKVVTDKTYTLCGTPGYISPECLQQRGYDTSADHWALGILIHEMLAGRSPFYSRSDMNRMDVFKSIVSDEYKPEPTTVISSIATDLISQLLIKDPSIRLGSLAKGAEEILHHEWFNSIDISLLRRRKLVAPWVPTFENQYDLCCFEDWSSLQDKTTIPQKPISSKHQKIFESF